MKNFRFNVSGFMIFDVRATSKKNAIKIATEFSRQWDAYALQVTPANSCFSNIQAIATDNKPNFHHVQPKGTL